MGSANCIVSENIFFKTNQKMIERTRMKRRSLSLIYA